MPQTHPVQGKIVLKGKAGNMRSLVGGRVRLQSMTDQGLFGTGEIEDGGTFSVGMVYKEKPLSGVPAGQYKLRIDLPDADQEPDDDDRGRRRKLAPAVIHSKYRDFNKSGITVTVPTAGEVVLTLEPPR